MTTIAMLIRLGSLGALIVGIASLVKGSILVGIGLILAAVVLHIVTNGLLGVAYRLALDKQMRGEPLSEDELNLLNSRR